MNVNKVMRGALAAGVLVLAGNAEAQLETESEVAGLDFLTALGWDSRYVSEGRDNLDGDSLAGATVEAGVGNLTLGLWYADSPEQEYREFNAYAAYGLEWGAFEGYVAYNHLQFLDDDEHDNELGAGIAYTALPLNLSIGVDATYSFEAESSTSRFPAHGVKGFRLTRRARPFTV